MWHRAAGALFDMKDQKLEPAIGIDLRRVPISLQARENCAPIALSLLPAPGRPTPTPQLTNSTETGLGPSGRATAPSRQVAMKADAPRSPARRFPCRIPELAPPSSYVRLEVTEPRAIFGI